MNHCWHLTLNCNVNLQITIGKNDKGLKLYDPGYLNTAPVHSSICYIDGDEGILRYRGYPIEQLAEGSTYLEVAYLLMYGSLPSETQLADWEFAVSQHSAVPQGILVCFLFFLPLYYLMLLLFEAMKHHVNTGYHTSNASWCSSHGCSSQCNECSFSFSPRCQSCSQSKSTLFTLLV